jgi:Tfp pilus assembly pilus retraction ATPase PilT
MNSYNFMLTEGSFTYDDFTNFLQWATLEAKANDIFIETNEPLGIKKDDITYNVTETVITYDEISAIINDTRFYETSASAALMTGRREIDFSYALSYGEDQILRYRVNISACSSIESPIKGIEIVLRPTAGVPPTAKELCLPQKYIDTCKFKEGLVLVTGPTGSGKTTTLAALISHIATTQKKHILTAEDPMEYDFKLINNRSSRIIQSEISTNIASFSLFASNALRRSPDVVLMGELRDAKSIEGGARIAQTGHLVYATGHTNDAASALERFADEFEFTEKRGKLVRLIANTKCVIHQRLLRKRGGGRIAIHEDLFLTSKIKMALYSRMSTGGDGVTDLFQHFVETEGTTLTSSIKEAFRGGQLDLETCIDQIAEKLTSEDVDWFANEIEQLHLKGIINELEVTHWRTLISAYLKQHSALKGDV